MFPSSVADYLRRTKKRNKLNVTFDYDTERFVAIGDGEFVLVTNTSEEMTPIVIPRAAHFESRRDFYELYQDFYHCRSMNIGEVQVIEPAIVRPDENGWKFESTGLLEVAAEQSSSKVHTSVTPEGEKPVRSSEPTIEERTEETTTTPCLHCGSEVETKFAFCWRCGNSMRPDASAGQKPSEKVTPLRRIAGEDDEPTVEHEIDHIQRSILSSVPSWRRSAR
ncbi:MAG TPA: hypothetical protein VJ023_04425 [Pyrinomonadaceae bacterium]|nr:hypothetical protein [Pyrinomonadaceae bacterium]